MNSRRVALLSPIILAVILAALPGRSSGAFAGARALALPAKKVCHTVTKKVHGKKKKVKVCKTVKAKKTPTPTDTPTPTTTPTPTATLTLIPVSVTSITPSIQALPPAPFPAGEVRIGSRSSPATDGAVTGVATGDLNGDGSEDVVVLHAASDTLSVLLSDGKSGFTTPVDYPTGKNPTNVTIGDTNGDGHPDLVVYNAGSDTLGLYGNNGDGTFSAPPSMAMRSVRAQSRFSDQNGSGQTLAVPAPLARSPSSLIEANLHQIALALHSPSMVAVWHEGAHGLFGPPSVTNLPLFTGIDGAAILPVPGGTSQLVLLGTSGVATGPVLAGFGFDANGVLLSAPAFADTIVGATLPTTASASNALGTFTNPAGLPVVDFSASVGGSTAIVLVSLHSTEISVNGYTYPSCPPGSDISPSVTNGPPGAIKLISPQTGQMCWIFFDRNGQPGRGQYVPAQQDPNDLPTWATVTNDPALLWFDSSGAFYTAPVTSFGGSDTITGFGPGAGTLQFSVTLQAGTAPIYGLDLLGLHDPTAGSVSVTGLPGASVTPFNGGIHVSTGTPLPSSFTFTVGNLQPISASDLVRVFGNNVNGTETVWFNQSTVTSSLRR